MLSNLKNQSLGLPLAALICLGGLHETASAWQFRDLDKPSSETPTAIESTEILDLIPTDQTFVDPGKEVAVEAESKPKSKSKLEPKTLAAPTSDSSASTPMLKPVPEGQPEPEPTLAEPPGAKPIPMAELLEKDSASSKAEQPADALKSFSATDSDTDEDIFAIDFKNLRPGESTGADVLEILGKAARTVEIDDDAKTLVYRDPLFKQVEVTVTNDVVSSILIHFNEPTPTKHVAKELGVDDLRAVAVPDEFGEILGLAVPERGLLFSFTGDAADEKIGAILLEPISDDMFRLRAQYNFDYDYENAIADLEQAISIDPMDAESHWLLAEYLDASCLTRQALRSAQKAVRLKPTSPVYRLTRARLYAKSNRAETAISDVRDIIKELELSNEVAARAHKLLGDLLALGPKADHQEALKNHLKAIDYGSKVVEDRRFAVRRAAKHVLVTAHMSVARDIALGNFQRQADVVPKWLLRAAELADEFISDDKGDKLLEMQLFRDTLACYSELPQGSFEASIATEEAMETAKSMISKSTDKYYRTQVQLLLAESMLHASKIHRSHGKYDMALKFANNGLALLDNSSEDIEETPHDKYLKSQLCFAIGSIKAIRDEDHPEAVEWYTKARSAVVGSNFITPLYSNQGHGQMYVSMGLSYWEVGEQEKAIKVTQTGANLMKQAVESGSLQLQAMAVPYGNLATMHGKLGKGSKSQEYAKLVAKLESVTKQQR